MAEVTLTGGAQAYGWDLPGGYVRQRQDVVGGDCFSACVSMLTGIDLELLPVHPPAMKIGENVHGEGWVHVLPGDNWDDWKSLLLDNGFRLEFVDDADTYIAGSYHPNYYAHAVVVHNGFIINPAIDEVIKVEECGWILGVKATVTPL